MKRKEIGVLDMRMLRSRILPTREFSLDRPRAQGHLPRVSVADPQRPVTPRRRATVVTSERGGQVHMRLVAKPVGKSVFDSQTALAP
jgi:hypothetical protein